MKNKLLHAATMSALLMMGQGMALPEAAMAQESATQAYQIPAGDLDSALRQYATQNKLQLVYPAELVEGKRSAGLSGSYTPTEALRRLLEGSGLQAQPINARTIGLRPSTQNTKPRTEAVPPPQSNESEEQANVVELEPIVVTGTNIRGGASFSPQMTVNRDDIIERGYISTDQIIDALPQNFSGGAQRGAQLGDPSDDSRNNFGRGSSVNLRGLGAGATLVLLNGRRFPGSSPGQFADISLVPVSAIERVEVVTDGASAIYGSDAIAGVVNIVLRDDYDGTDMHANYGAASRGGYAAGSADISFGNTFDGGSLIGGIEYRHRSNLDSNDRSFSRSAVDPTDLFGSEKFLSGFFSGVVEISERADLRTEAYVSKRDVESSFTNGQTQALFISNPETTQLGANLGVTWEAGGDWLVDTNLAYGENEITDGPSRTTPNSNRFRGTSESLDVKADGTLLSAPGGDVRLALGSSFLREDYKQVFTGEPATNATAGHDRTAIFAEMLIPLVGEGNQAKFLERLELSVALRHENYTDFGSTTNPKFGLLWQPSKDLTVRGTYGTSFRAPTFTESVAQSELAVLLPLPDQSSPSGSTLTLLRIAGANPTLRPEEATTWTAGIDFTPSTFPGFRLSTTYFSIDYRDRIERPTGNPNFFLAGGPELLPFVDRSPDADLLAEITSRPFTGNSGFISFIGPFNLSDIEAFADNRFANIAKSRMTGVDLQLAYSRSLPVGELRSRLDATYLLSGKRSLQNGSTSTSFIDTLGNPIGLRLRADVGLVSGPVSATAAANYVDSYKVAAEPAIPIDSWLTFDLNLALSLDQLSASKSLEGVRVGLNILNVFDRNPPSVTYSTNFLSPIGYDPTNANPIGRFVSIDIRKSF